MKHRAHKIEIDHCRRKQRDEVPNYFAVKVDGFEVYKTHYVRSRNPAANAMRVEAESAATTLARKLRKALDLSDTEREQLALEQLALAMVPIAAASAAKGKGAIEVMRDAFVLAEAFRIAAHEERSGVVETTEPSDDAEEGRPH